MLRVSAKRKPGLHAASHRLRVNGFGILGRRVCLGQGDRQAHQHATPRGRERACGRQRAARVDRFAGADNHRVAAPSRPDRSWQAGGRPRLTKTAAATRAPRHDSLQNRPAFAGNNDVLATSHFVLARDAHGYYLDLLPGGQEGFNILFNGLTHFNIVQRQFLLGAAQRASPQSTAKMARTGRRPRANRPTALTTGSCERLQWRINAPRSESVPHHFPLGPRVYQSRW